MNQPLILIQPTTGDKFNTTTTLTVNKIDDFSIGIVKAELDKLLSDNKIVINNAIIKADISFQLRK